MQGKPNVGEGYGHHIKMGTIGLVRRACQNTLDAKVHAGFLNVSLQKHEHDIIVSAPFQVHACAPRGDAQHSQAYYIFQVCGTADQNPTYKRIILPECIDVRASSGIVLPQYTSFCAEIEQSCESLGCSTRVLIRTYVLVLVMVECHNVVIYRSIPQRTLVRLGAMRLSCIWVV